MSCNQTECLNDLDDCVMCSPSLIGNGHCDEACDSADFEYDGGIVSALQTVTGPLQRTIAASQHVTSQSVISIMDFAYRLHRTTVHQAASKSICRTLCVKKSAIRKSANGCVMLT